MEEKIHGLVMEKRQKLTITLCEEVVSFNDNEVILIAGESTLVIKGENLKVEEVSKQNMEAYITGDCIDSIMYAKKGGKHKESLVRRILK